MQFAIMACTAAIHYCIKSFFNGRSRILTSQLQNFLTNRFKIHMPNLVDSIKDVSWVNIQFVTRLWAIIILQYLSLLQILPFHVNVSLPLHV